MLLQAPLVIRFGMSLVLASLGFCEIVTAKGYNTFDSITN